MVQKSRLPEVTVQTSISIDNQALKKDSKIKEVFVQALIDKPTPAPSGYSVIKFDPVKTKKAEDLRLYVGSQDPCLMREIQMKEGPAENQVLLSLEKFLCDLQNALKADYIMVNCSEGIVIYQSI